MPNDILIGFVLDMSGSMGYLRPSTIESFNQVLSEQQGQEGKCLLSLTKFNTEFDIAYVAHDINEVAPLGSPKNLYSPNGGTALYDAVGATVKGIEAWQKNNPDFTGDVKIIILTDGAENSSKEWHIYDKPSPEDARDVNNLISYKTNEGWEFIYMGSGKSAWLESRRFTAVPQANTYAMQATSGSTSSAYAGMSRGITSSRLVGSSLASNLAQDSAFKSVAVNRGDEDQLEEDDA